MIVPPAKRLLQVLETDTLSDAKVVIKRLPNVLIEEGKNDNGSFTVTWRNWTKYQADSTIYSRVKRLRYKRRGEEKRKEEKRGDESVVTPAAPVTGVEFKVNSEIVAALAQAPKLGAVTRLWTVDFWRAEVRANPGVDFAPELLKAEAWLAANPQRAPRKDLARFLHNWLARADHGEDA